MLLFLQPDDDFGGMDVGDASSDEDLDDSDASDDEDDEDEDGEKVS